ncbi:Uma2 family endonuclease [Nonomuraea rubra]|uniref:Uma2 family endonuclease n=1 Tax=Nonomuraea rubra TaxID=46180 RepID=UPI0031E88AFF
MDQAGALLNSGKGFPWMGHRVESFNPPSIPDTEHVSAYNFGPTILPGKPPFTVDDLFGFPDDGNRYELCDGSLLVSPPHTVRHQVALKNALFILDDAATHDLAALMQVNFRASDTDCYIPDLVVMPRNAAFSTELMISPHDILLIGEIVGHTTSKQDKGLKPVAHAEAGIPTYWRIEPDEGPTLYVYQLHGDVYGPPTAYQAGTTAKLTAPFPVSFDPAQFLD